MPSDFWYGLATGLAAVIVAQALSSARSWRANVRADQSETRQLERQIALERSRRELENIYALQDAAWKYQRFLDLRAHEMNPSDAPPDSEEWIADERRLLLAGSSLFDSRERMRMYASRCLDEDLKGLVTELDETGWRIDTERWNAVFLSYNLLRSIDARVAQLIARTGLETPVPHLT